MNVILLYFSWHLIHIQSYLWLYQWHFQKTNKIEHTSLILKTIFASLVCEWLLYKFSLSSMMQLYIYIVHVLAQQGSVLHVKILLGVQNTEANKSQNKLLSFVYFIYVHLFHVYTNVNEWIQKMIGFLFLFYISPVWSHCGKNKFVSPLKISVFLVWVQTMWFNISLTHKCGHNLTNNKNNCTCHFLFYCKKKICAGWRKWETMNLITTKPPPNVFCSCF